MIRKMNKKDFNDFLEMATIFYNSNAISGSVSDEAILYTFNNIVNDNPLIKGYIIEPNGNTAGFFIISFTFQTQYGKTVLLFEDMYIKPLYQGMSLGTKVFNYLEETYNDKVGAIKFEVSKENIRAINLYKRLGYVENSYLNMIKEF